MDGEVVDGFVGLWWISKRSGGEHGTDGLCVGKGKGFVLYTRRFLTFFSKLIERCACVRLLSFREL